MAQIGVDIGSYSFDASAGTVTITGITINDIEQVKPIVNGERGEVIFNPATNGAFGTLAANVLTLEYDTTLHADTDPLYICVNLLEADLATEATLLNVDTSLTNLNAKDFSTETTQILVKDLLTLLEAKDFSTETTLQGVNLNATRSENLLSELIQEQKKTNKILRKIGNDE